CLTFCSLYLRLLLNRHCQACFGLCIDDLLTIFAHVLFKLCIIYYALYIYQQKKIRISGYSTSKLTVQSANDASDLLHTLSSLLILFRKIVESFCVDLLLWTHIHTHLLSADI